MSKVLEYLAECQAICDAATLPPWEASHIDSGHFEVTHTQPCGYWISEYSNQGDTDFVAHARTAEPRLIEAISELREAAINDKHNDLERTGKRPQNGDAERLVDRWLLAILQPEPTGQPERKTDENDRL